MKRPEVRKRTRQLLSYVILLLCVIALMMSLRTCSSPPAGMLKEIRPSGGDTIDVAISYSPMTLYRYADTLGGFSRDMLAQMAAADCFVLKYHPVTSVEQSLKGLGDGLYDLVVCDIARTSDFGPGYAFTSDVYLDKQVLVQRINKADTSAMIRNQLDLAGRHVLVESMSPAYWRMRRLISEIGDTIYIDTDSRYTSEQLFLKVAAGDADFAVVNERVAQILSPDYPEVDITTGVSFTQFQSWITREDDKVLLDRFNAAIDRFKQTDAYRCLCSRYGFEAPEIKQTKFTKQ
jgi:ABC transporter, substrate-binding protein, family 3